MIKFDYPITPKLIKALKQEYREESIEKGNSWRTTTIIDNLPTEYWLLTIKLTEEYTEIREIIDRMNYNAIEWYKKLNYKRDILKAELKDLILVACMAYERLDV